MSNKNPKTRNDGVVSRYDDDVMPIWKSLGVPVNRASDCVIEDCDGNEYLDVFCGISVTNVGHNDAVVEGAKAQLGERLTDQGIVIGVGGYHKNVMRFQPPLTIDRDQLRRPVEGLRTALREETA